MTHLFKKINFWSNEHADFLFHEQENPEPNIYTCANVKFDNAMFFARVWGTEEDTMKQLSEGLDDNYGTLTIFYYPERMVTEALKRIGLIKEAILSNNMVSKNLTLEDIPKKDMSNIGFVPWIGEHTALGIFTKNIKMVCLSLLIIMIKMIAMKAPILLLKIFLRTLMKMSFVLLVGKKTQVETLIFG